jgi:hypothetical protein
MTDDAASNGIATTRQLLSKQAHQTQDCLSDQDGSTLTARKQRMGAATDVRIVR